METSENRRKLYARWFLIRLAMVLFDIFAVNFAYFIALIIRFYVNFEINEWAVRYIPAFRAFAPWYTVCCLVIFGAFKLYIIWIIWEDGSLERGLINRLHFQSKW